VAEAVDAGREWLPFGLPEDVEEREEGAASEGEGESRRCGTLWLSRSRVVGEVWHTDSRPWRFYCDAAEFR
jgi:hypothetical protein